MLVCRWSGLEELNSSVRPRLGPPGSSLVGARPEGNWASDVVRLSRLSPQWPNSRQRYYSIFVSIASMKEFIMVNRRERAAAIRMERTARVWEVLVEKAIAGEIVPYECLACETNTPFVPLCWGEPAILNTIHDYCTRQDLPPLNAIAVNIDTRIPGPGFFRRSNDAEGDARRVFEMGGGWRDVAPPV